MRGEVLDRLALKYDETRVAGGLTNNGLLLEVLTTDDGATWTIIMTSASGITCLFASGEDWRRLNPLEPRPGPGL